MRSLFRYFIEGAAGRVSTAEDGGTAVEAVRRADNEGQPIDVVLMDIQMPELNGYEATRNLRRRLCKRDRRPYGIGDEN